MTEGEPHTPVTRAVSVKETAAPYRATDLTADHPLRTPEDRGWEEFRDACRRQMRRPLDQRIQYGFCRMYKPVLDDADWRAFATMKEYREWCAAQLPDYLGFKPGTA